MDPPVLKGQGDGHGDAGARHVFHVDGGRLMLSVECLDPDLRTAVVIRPTDVTTRGKHIESA